MPVVWTALQRDTMLLNRIKRAPPTRIQLPHNAPGIIINV